MPDSSSQTKGTSISNQVLTGLILLKRGLPKRTSDFTKILVVNIDQCLSKSQHRAQFSPKRSYNCPHRNLELSPFSRASCPAFSVELDEFYKYVKILQSVRVYAYLQIRLLSLRTYQRRAVARYWLNLTADSTIYSIPHDLL